MYSIPVHALRTLAVLAIGALASPSAAGEPLTLPEELREALAGDRLQTVDQLRLLQQQVRRVVERARPVTVAVELNDSIGSGVIVSADGLVLTAGHVSVEPNREIQLRFPDNRVVAGRSLGVNHRLDSGLVRITSEPPVDPKTGDAGWPHAPLAEAAAEPGDWVVCLGQPNGFVADRAPPVRLGRVLYENDEAINTDATLVGGDSGGPLLNLRGEVVGIHSKIGEKISSNYHVPVAAYRRQWRYLLAGRMTGVPEGEDPDDWRPLVGLSARDQGGRIVVTQVYEGMPADQAGVAVGDIITAFAGRDITSLDQVDRLIHLQMPYDRVPLKLRRGEETVELELWLGRASIEFPGSRPAGGPG